MPFHLYKSDISNIEIPEKFTFPFYYTPHPLAIMACEELQEYLENTEDFIHNFGLDALDDSLAIGKMFGVLICKNDKNEIGFLWAFSGKLGNSNEHPMFVPPVFDMLTKDSFFRKEEHLLNQINQKIEDILENENYLKTIHNLELVKNNAYEDIEKYRFQIKLNKEKRDIERKIAESLEFEIYKNTQKKLSKMSQEEQILLKKMQKHWNYQIETAQKELDVFNSKIEILKQERKEKSGALQQKLFDSYGFLNYFQEIKSIGNIFKNNPPAGAGECAAPKLLHYCFLKKWKPFAMAEFWWGKSPNSEIRQHKNYYPACKSKCEPILMQHLLKGLEIDENPLVIPPLAQKNIEIIYEDEYMLVLNKPAEMLTVPGKNIKESVYQWIKDNYPDASGPLIVHRLDQSTSGILLVAKNLETYIKLQKQFIQKTIQKRYVAILSNKIEGNEGFIDLPLRVDLDDRPRQLVCYEYGKTAQTRWKVIEKNEKTTKVYFYPITGRTHQLRVHAAHSLGLNASIVGDDLYGIKENRLYLHAEKITFLHPKTKNEISFKVDAGF